VLQCVAAVSCGAWHGGDVSLVGVAVCCSVLQCVAVWYRVVQCVAVCCSVLQCHRTCLESVNVSHMCMVHMYIHVKSGIMTPDSQNMTHVLRVMFCESGVMREHAEHVRHAVCCGLLRIVAVSHARTRRTCAT